MKVLTAAVVSWVATKLGRMFYKCGNRMLDVAIGIEDWAGIGDWTDFNPGGTD